MKSIYPEQLASTFAQMTKLGQEFPRAFLLIGSDPLLALEAKEQICKHALSRGFDDKYKVEISASTDWDELFLHTQSQGLFATRQLMLLDLPENLTVGIQKNLAKLISFYHEDLALILQAPKFGKTQEKQNWVKDFSDLPSLIINCSTPAPDKLPQWLHQRSNAMGLDVSAEAGQLLCYNYESNLLALKQCLQLLNLLYGDSKIDLMRAQKVVEQSSAFTVFQWVDALLMGNFSRANQILHSLQQNEIAPIILIRTIQKELITILHLTQLENCSNIDLPLASYNLRAKFDELRIWSNRRPMYSAIISRLSYRQLFELIQKLAELERASKQNFDQNLWNLLAEFGGQMCGTKEILAPLIANKADGNVINPFDALRAKLHS